MAALLGRAFARGIGRLRIRSFRAYLVALVVAVALPLVLFALMQAVHDARQQRRTVELGLLNTARAVAVALEQALQGSVSALNALAASTDLETGNLAAFYEEARRVRELQPWYSVWLVDRDGRQLLNLLRPYGSELPPVADREYVQRALASGRPAVSGLVQGRLTPDPHVAVAVPVLQQARVRYVLVAGIEPGALAAIIVPPRDVAPTGITSIVDREYRVLARNRDAGKWIGRPATAQYIDVISQGAEGVGRATTLEGGPSYIAFRHLEPAGWTVGVGLDADSVDGPVRREIALTAAVGLAMLCLAVAAARLLGRRLTRPIAQLATSARDIAEDRPPALPADMPLRELADLKHALERAGQAIAERRRVAEREQQFAFELAEAEDRERRQIARDLHDDLGQTLAALQIRLALLCRHQDGDVAEAARDIAALAQRADRFTRTLSEQIAPPVLCELGLRPALDWLAQEMAQQFGLQVQLHAEPGAEELAPQVRSIAYRAVRELLINVAKHARCGSACVELRCEPRFLRLAVRDQGAGFDAAGTGTGRGPGGMGLRSVRERLLRIGGTFELRSVPGQGTEVLLQVPTMWKEDRERAP